MSNTQLVAADFKSLAFGDMTAEDVIVIRDSIAKDATPSQFKYFMGVAKMADANPLIGEIHFSAYKNKNTGQETVTIQYGVDFYKRKARENPEYAGHDAQLVCEKDDFQLEQITHEGNSFIGVKVHTIEFPRGKVIGAYAIARRKGMPPYVEIVEVDEIQHLRTSAIGMQKSMWTNYFGDMFKKFVLKRALKNAFGLSFPKDEDEPEATYVQTEGYRQDITPEPERLETIQEPEIVNPGGDTPVRSKEVAALHEQLKGKLAQLNVVTNKEVAAYLKKKKLELKDTVESYTEVINMVDMDIEDKDGDPL